MPDGSAPSGVRQIERKLGPDWPGKGPPPPGFYDRRSAYAALEALLTGAASASTRPRCLGLISRIPCSLRWSASRGSDQRVSATP